MCRSQRDLGQQKLLVSVGHTQPSCFSCRGLPFCSGEMQFSSLSTASVFRKEENKCICSYVCFERKTNCFIYIFIYLQHFDRVYFNKASPGVIWATWPHHFKTQAGQKGTRMIKNVQARLKGLALFSLESEVFSFYVLQKERNKLFSTGMVEMARINGLKL